MAQTEKRAWEPPSKTEAAALRPKGTDDQRQLPISEELAPPIAPTKKKRRNSRRSTND